MTVNLKINLAGKMAAGLVLLTAPAFGAPVVERLPGVVGSRQTPLLACSSRKIATASFKPFGPVEEVLSEVRSVPAAAVSGTPVIESLRGLSEKIAAERPVFAGNSRFDAIAEFYGDSPARGAAETTDPLFSASTGDDGDVRSSGGLGGGSDGGGDDRKPSTKPLPVDSAETAKPTADGLDAFALFAQWHSEFSGYMLRRSANAWIDASQESMKVATALQLNRMAVMAKNDSVSDSRLIIETARLAIEVFGDYCAAKLPTVGDMHEFPLLFAQRLELLRRVYACSPDMESLRDNLAYLGGRDGVSAPSFREPPRIFTVAADSGWVVDGRALRSFEHIFQWYGEVQRLVGIVLEWVQLNYFGQAVVFAGEEARRRFRLADSLETPPNGSSLLEMLSRYEEIHLEALKWHGSIGHVAAVVDFTLGPFRQALFQRVDIAALNEELAKAERRLQRQVKESQGSLVVHRFAQ